MSRIRWFVPALLTTGFLAGVASAERVTWKAEEGGNGHEYEVIVAEDGISFIDAQRAAEDQGGHLATIASKEENEFVFKLIDDEKYWGSDGYNAYGPWIGGYQDAEATEPNKGWAWVTGEAWQFDDWSPGAGEPNDGDGFEDHGEDYLHFFSFGSTGREAKWNDSGDTAPNVIAYVIEWTPKKELEAQQAAAKPAAADSAEGMPADDQSAAGTADSTDASESN